MPSKVIRRARSKKSGRARARLVAAVFGGVCAAALIVGGLQALAGISLLSDRGETTSPLFAETEGALKRFPVEVTDPHPAAPSIAPGIAHDFLSWVKANVTAGKSLRGFEAGTDPGAPQPSAIPVRMPAIAIVIDDLGSDAAATRRAAHLPRAVTMSFLPYPEATPILAREAIEAGHEIIVHVPMEPEGRDDPGPNALRPELSQAEIIRRLAWDFARVPGFDGINNHMGSRFTASRAALVPVVETLAERHLFFLDSRTTPASMVVAVAHEFGVESASRDVFLDDDESAGAVGVQLALTERIARRDGIAIAIGHPHEITLAALENWCAHLKGITLVPVRDAIRARSQQRVLSDLRE